MLNSKDGAKGGSSLLGKKVWNFVYPPEWFWNNMIQLKTGSGDIFSRDKARFCWWMANIVYNPGGSFHHGVELKNQRHWAKKIALANVGMCYHRLLGWNDIKIAVDINATLRALILPSFPGRCSIFLWCGCSTYPLQTPQRSCLREFHTAESNFKGSKAF